MILLAIGIYLCIGCLGSALVARYGKEELEKHEPLVGALSHLILIVGWLPLILIALIKKE